ncbi:MAG: ABC transporter substrate-binding protein [Gammaproteobacteria bacterium]|nr:ABC transporter substrate-binding protein [Gammaproteobacteria bacterium]MBU1624894.1 ABC transporter substrate-binding protein [Gammaproteobacteria bacterium]MBU1982738.1 ABC transporter substrate-binding protein [Gammaproteobacteria bacterium]
MKKILLVLLMATMGMSAWAEEVNATPDGLIMATVREVLAVVKQDNSIVTDQPRLQALVNEKILPHFDFTRMTQLAVGRPWRTATAEQKESLVREFRAMLVRTYTKVFSTYPDPEVEVKSARLLDENEATVRSVIRVSDGRVVTVDYEMRKKEGDWKAFDVTVEGISMVTSYRGSFADEIKQVGIDGLIKTLSEKNRDAGDTAAAGKKG